MSDDQPAATPPPATLEELQHWTGVIGSAQQLMLEHGVAQLLGGHAKGEGALPGLAEAWLDGSMQLVRAQSDFLADSMQLWQRFLDPAKTPELPASAAAARDRRFAAAQWRENPLFDLIRQSYFMVVDHMLRGVEAIDGLEPRQKEKLRFATRAMVDALSPTNFVATNPEVLEKLFETRGENLLTGLERLVADIGRGQLTHTDSAAFEVGRNIATTPGKVIRETPLY